MTASTRMDPGELQMVREYLGLTLNAMAGILKVNPRTLRSWEAGREKVPERIRVEVERIEAATGKVVTEVVEALSSVEEPAIEVYRTDAVLHAAQAKTEHLTARWWRHVVARAVYEVPGVVIVTVKEAS